ncbi:hypothetical protein [Actinomadura terrae]|uniref:hypothetical protein n=1 Tax=Actinomadura terrae TaxID=604353 RepID=UPI001FA7500A|nr:hypothetical protein [Actinomadura terrae]
MAFATLDPTGLLAPSAGALSAEGPALEVVPPGEIITDLAAATARFQTSFDALAAAHEPGLAPPAGTIDIAVQVWREGYHMPPSGNPASQIAWWILDAGSAPERPEAGAIIIADPRSGPPVPSALARLWGRHLMIGPRPGSHIAVPGWLTASVQPVEAGQYVLVAIASTAR